MVSTKSTQLDRKLGIVVVTIYGLGNIVGAGIYALVGKVAGEAGMATPFTFLAAMIVAAFSGLAFAELSSRLPYSEGATAYVHAAFKRRSISIAVGVILAIAIVVSAATLARAFGGYLSAATGLSVPLGSALIIVIFGILVSFGIKESTRVFAAHTIFEIFGLILIIWLGRSSFGHYVSQFSLPTHVSTFGIGGMISGVFLAFYAFIGVEDIVHLAEETKHARRIIPLAIIISLSVAAVLYFLVSIVTVSSVPIDQLNQSNAPLSLVFQSVSRFPGWFIALIALTASAGGVLAHLISGSRLFYGMSKRGLISKRMSEVSSTHRAPLLAITIVVLLSLILAVLVDIKFLATTTSFMILLVFAFVNISLVVLKLQHAKPKEGRFTIPVIIPVLGFISCLLLVGFQIVSMIR